MADQITLYSDVDIVAAAAESPDKLPTFSTLAYTGGPLRTERYKAGIIVDLAGLEVSPDITANLHHDATQIVGHADRVANDGRSLEILGTVSGTGDAAREFLGNGANGYRWKASVEVMPLVIEEIKAGARATVNGQSVVGPAMVARKSRLYGVAFVSRGADENTVVKIAASAAEPQEESVMDKVFSEWIVAQGFDPTALNDKQLAFLEAKHKAEGVAPIEASGFDLDDIKAAAAEHNADIELKLAEREDSVPAAKFATIKASAIKSARDLKSKAIREKWTTARLEVEAIKAASAVELELVKAERPTGPAIHASNRDISGDAIEAAMCVSLKLPDVEKQYKEPVLEQAHKLRGLGLQRVLIMAAANNGMQIGPGERLSQGNLREALRYAFSPVHAAASVVSLPGIFSNVANKSLLSGYMDEDQAWREFSRVKTVTDFKQNTSYRMLDSMEYEELGPNGEIKHGRLGEESFTNQAKTYAKMFALTREQIINDDLGAFDDLRNRLGRGAARKFNNLFWTKFLADHSTFYTTARTNYISGATTNLGVDGVGLSLGVKAFREMRSPSADGSKRMNARPEILLVPTELEGIAEALFRNQNLGAVASSAANIHAGKYRPVVCPWLSDSAFTGYSTTAWYLFQNPAVLAPMTVSFLNGMETPTVESADADFDQLGVQFRGYHDFGCDQAEYLAGVKSKGAA